MNNIQLLLQTCPAEYSNNVDIEIYCYDDSTMTPYQQSFDARIIHKQGVIGQYIYNDLKPDRIESYDRVVLLLDDVELQRNCSLSDMIDIQDKYHFDILSPCLTHDSKYSHKFMLQHESSNCVVRDVNFLEFFLYVFKPSDGSYRKWHELFDQDTKWMWGMDYVLHNYLKLKLGLLNTMSMKHWFKNNKSPENLSAENVYARNELKRFCDKYKTNLSLLPKQNLSYIT